MKDAARNTIILVFFLTASLFWLGSVVEPAIQLVARPLLGSDVTNALLAVLIGFLTLEYVSFSVEWHRQVYKNWDSYSLESRLVILRIAMVGSLSYSPMLVANYIILLVEELKITTIPTLVNYIPTAAFVAVLYVLRLRIAETRKFTAMFEALETLDTAKPAHQAFCIKGIRGLVTRKIRHDLPHVRFDLTNLFNKIYCVSQIGGGLERETLKAHMSRFKQAFDSGSVHDLVNTLVQADAALQSPMFAPLFNDLKFNWEGRTDWWKIIERAGYLVLVASAFVPILQTLKFLQ